MQDIPYMHRKRGFGEKWAHHRRNLWRPLVRSYLQTQHFSKDVQFLHLDLHRFLLRVFFSSSLAHEDCRFFYVNLCSIFFLLILLKLIFFQKINFLSSGLDGFSLRSLVVTDSIGFLLCLRNLQLFSPLRIRVSFNSSMVFCWHISLLVRKNFQWFGDCWKDSIRENSSKAMTQWMWILNS